MIASPVPVALVRAFARDSCAAAGIELALGATVLLSVSALCFDLYARIKADTAAARMAVTMADYVSRDSNPNGNEMKALGQYLHRHELGAPADLVYVITALHQPTGDPPPAVALLWTDASIRIGDAAVTTTLASACPRFIDGGAADLPDGFTMLPDEVVVVVEVCARLTREGSLTGKFVAGDIYRLHALPAREPGQTPAAPVYAVGNHAGPETLRADASGDDNWASPANGEGYGGPNYQCTRPTLLPLTSDTAVEKAKLQSLDDDSLWGGSTTAHVGVTWGRRMLASSWRTVWGGERLTRSIPPGIRPARSPRRSCRLPTGSTGESIPSYSESRRARRRMNCPRTSRMRDEMDAIRNPSMPAGGGPRTRKRAAGPSLREGCRAGSERFARITEDDRCLDDRAFAGSP